LTLDGSLFPFDGFLGLGAPPLLVQLSLALGRGIAVPPFTILSGHGSALPPAEFLEQPDS
jgi:hypothetical protein